MGFPGSSVVKNLFAMQETQIRSLGGEDPLEEKMATHSSILAWRIPRTEEPAWLWARGSQRVGHDLACTVAATLVPPLVALNESFPHREL